jgi:hypothetical protein
MAITSGIFPQLLVGQLQMDDVHRNLARRPIQCFGNGLEHPLSFSAHVRNKRRYSPPPRMATRVSVSIHDPGGPLSELETPALAASQCAPRPHLSIRLESVGRLEDRGRKSRSDSSRRMPMFGVIPPADAEIAVETVHARACRHFPPTGAADSPSPKIMDVTPCRTMLSAFPSVTMELSEWLWMSMKPGATTSPVASMILVAERPSGPDGTICPLESQYRLCAMDCLSHPPFAPRIKRQNLATVQAPTENDPAFMQVIVRRTSPAKQRRGSSGH